MSRIRLMRWTISVVAFLLPGLMVVGCSTLPTSGTKPETPGTPWTAKSSGSQPAGQPAALTQAVSQAEFIQPNSVLYWSVLTRDSMPNQSASSSQVAPDGSIEIGVFGSVKVAGLTVPQASMLMEQQFSRSVRDPIVRISTSGPVQQVQATDWSASQKGSTGVLAPPGPSAWQPPITGQPATNESNHPAVMALPPLQSPSPVSTLPPNWQVKPGTDAVEKDKQPPEEAPAPRPLSGKAPEGTKVNVALEPGHPQVAIYPEVPNEAHPVTLPTYIIGVPDLLLIDSLEGLLTQPIRGSHLVRQDGTVGVGTYGSAYVAGMTLEQAKEAIARVVHSRLDPKKKTLKDVLEGLSVDVLAYNSKVYYVITDRVGYGENVARFPVTGNETVLDAISQTNGLPPEANKRHICLARRSPDGKKEVVLPVDWIGISQKGLTATNYQILPGDRLYVRADRLITLNFVLGKILTPIERILGVTLLGSQTVNSIRQGTTP